MSSTLLVMAAAAAAAAKSLQLCPTLCNSIDGSPPGPAIPGIREMQTKTTRRYYLTPTGMAVVTKTVSSVGKDVEKLEASCSVGNGSALQK